MISDYVYGCGDGHGSGYGYGYGAGAGRGYGAGYDDGYGSGYGSSYGYGYGSDYGDGYGSDYGASGDNGNPNALAYTKAILSGWTQENTGTTIAFWRADTEGCPVNGGRDGKSRKVGDVERVDGPLTPCSPRALHGTRQPWRHKGERLFVVALRGEVHESDGKLAALEREILGEIPNPWRESR